MPPERPKPGSPGDWMRYARSDLELSRSGRQPGVLLEGLCFHAQQAVEKSLKALLVNFGIPFPGTHNIRILIDLLPPDIAQPIALERSAGLTDYAVMSRYPGNFEPVEEDEYVEALQLAENVVQWAEKILSGSG
jgi:HEPN domain-containing protein